MEREIIIGSRGSDLALFQAEFVQSELKKRNVKAEIKVIKTKGDQIQHLSFDKIEGKGFFTKEIEEELVGKSIDLAVHSHKDLETNDHPELKIAAVSEREDPSDLLILRKEAVNTKLPLSIEKGAIIGTSSARRKMQLLSFKTDVKLKDLRGNVPTRIQKLREGLYDGIILAKAGITRLNIDLSEFHTEPMDPREFIPSPAQGVLALQIRKDDQELDEILQKLDVPEVRETVEIERKVLNLFDGGCQLPLGVYSKKENDDFHTWASVSETANGSPKRIYFQSQKKEDIAELIVQKLKSNASKRSVFISRKLPKNTYFKRILENVGFTVHAEPLTVFNQVEFNEIPQTDWVFFSSKNCVKHFFSQNPVLSSNTKYGCIGGATNAALKAKGYTAHFVGDSTDTLAIGKDFSEVVKNESVLFPQSSSSYRTIQKQFSNQENLHEIIAYHSVENEKATVPETDIVVLTSPTNAILYFRHQTPKKGQTFIAMGNSTATTIREHGVKNCIIPWNSSVIALADAVMSA